MIEPKTDQNAFKLRWLQIMRAMPWLTDQDRQAAEWLAANLALGTTVLRTWLQLKNGANLSNHDAGVAVGNLKRAGLVGERIQAGPRPGFPLLLPLPKRETAETFVPPETRADVEARNARRAAAQRAADLRADAKWLARK